MALDQSNVNISARIMTIVLIHRLTARPSSSEMIGSISTMTCNQVSPCYMQTWRLSLAMMSALPGYMQVMCKTLSG